MPRIIGIDPGLTGAIAMLDAAGGTATVVDMPVIKVSKGKSTKTSLNLGALLTLFEFHTAHVDFAIIEAQQAYPNQGSVSNYSIGFGYAAILMALTSCGIPYQTVHPRTWQKMFGIQGNTKGMSCQIAERMFPTVELRGPRGRALDGRADACLLAEFGLRAKGWK